MCSPEPFVFQTHNGNVSPISFNFGKFAIAITSFFRETKFTKFTLFVKACFAFITFQTRPKKPIKPLLSKIVLPHRLRPPCSTCPLIYGVQALETTLVLAARYSAFAALFDEHPVSIASVASLQKPYSFARNCACVACSNKKPKNAI